jgi:hypothetical protein
VKDADRRFSPLDEVLGLLPGQLTPGLQGKLVRLGSWLPFGPAAELLTAFTGASVSKASCRRLTERAGAVQVAQQEAAVQAMESGELVQPERVVEKLLMSTDGAMVPLVGGEWAEVRTLAIGEVQVEETEEGPTEISTHALSYFSRLTDALSFQRAALVETERRGVLRAAQVAAVSDGAEWIPPFVDFHCPGAVRILDFPHAGERFTTIYQACRAQGVALADEWPDQQRQRLKEEGGTAVLETLPALQQSFPQVGLDEPIAYLVKRESMLNYPRFLADGARSSGVNESANKVVVEARLKGATHRNATRSIPCWPCAMSSATSAGTSAGRLSLRGCADKNGCSRLLRKNHRRQPPTASGCSIWKCSDTTESGKPSNVPLKKRNRNGSGNQAPTIPGVATSILIDVLRKNEPHPSREGVN